MTCSWFIMRALLTVCFVQLILLFHMELVLALTYFEKDWCSGIECQHGGTCIDVYKRFYCDCRGNYTGKYCEREIDVTHNALAYWYVPGSGTWASKLQECHKYGGTLASILDQLTEEKFLRQRSAFIGLSSTLADGIWRWTDTSTPFFYQNFLSTAMFGWDKTVVYATPSGWEVVSKDQTMEGALCMKRTFNQIQCDSSTDRSCLHYQNDYFEVESNKNVVGTLRLKVWSHIECRDLCRYNTYFFCRWFYFNETENVYLCDLGEDDPTPNSQGLDIYVRKQINAGSPLMGVCVELLDSKDTHSQWLTLEYNLVKVNDENVLEKVKTLLIDWNDQESVWTGLHSDQVGLWKYPGGSSPNNVFWDTSGSYPTGDPGCVAVTKEGKYELRQCSDELSAVHHVPAKFEYVGCFMDNANDRALSRDHMQYDTPVTLLTCIAFCRKNFAMYASLQGNVHCYCGVDDDTYNKHGAATDCVDCQGTLKCGGDASNAVYNLDPCKFAEFVLPADTEGEVVYDNNIPYLVYSCTIPGQRIVDIGVKSLRLPCPCDGLWTGIELSKCTAYDECASSKPCVNGGTCTNDGDSYTCQCAKGFEGKNCEIDYDDCNSTPCKNSGTCIDWKDGGYLCACKWDFIGVACEKARAPSAAKPDPHFKDRRYPNTTSSRRPTTTTTTSPAVTVAPQMQLDNSAFCVITSSVLIPAALLLVLLVTC